MGFVQSDLKLDGDAPVRVRPGVGEWGPVEVTTTSAKKRGRLIVPLLFVLALVVLIVVGFFWYKALHG
ncbi:MAG: hypothetical protein FWF36_08405 [Propionibacteriaceae bacterium]|nr:hypothetical protein [Propionibacteriaceae bacterium]